MESELVLLLKKRKEDLNRQISRYDAENDRIDGLKHLQTREDKKRIKDLIVLLKNAKEELGNIEIDLSNVIEIEQQKRELEETYEKLDDKDTKRARGILESIENKKSKLEKIESKYRYRDKEENLGPEISTSKNKINKSVVGAVSALAIALAIGIVIGKNPISLGSITKSNKNKNNNPEPAPSSSSVEEYTGEKTDDIDQELALVEQDGELFVDIFDEEQVALRAEEEVLNYYDELVPNLELTNEDAEELLKWMNNGNPKEVNRAEALNQVNTFEALLNNESNYSIDMVNKGYSLREEQNTIIDYGKFFIDGSKTQELATKFSEFRTDMILDPKNGRESAIGFTELLMNSCYLDGCDGKEISAYRLESSSNKVFIDKLILNTAMLAGAYDNIVVTNPLDGEKISLQDLIKEINNNNCIVEMTAEDGSRFDVYVNKFTYDMEGMLSELTYNKENIKTRSLTK